MDTNNSAEAKAIRRIQEEKEGKVVEWITVIELGEPIDIEEIRKRLGKRGYKIQIPCDQSD